MRKIEKIDKAVIEDYLDVYLNAYPAFKSLDNECRETYRKKTTFDMDNDKEVEFIGLFDDNKLVSTMKLVNYQMNLYGQMNPAVGLMSLAVHPLYKKQGIALDMVKYYEAYTKKAGAQVAVLLPFNMDFYHRMGYGFGSKLDEYHIPTTSLPKHKKHENLKLLNMDNIEEVLKCHNEFAEQNHGMLKKFEEEIREMRSDTSTIRVGYYQNDKLSGYAAYRFEEASKTNYTENIIVVDELIYSNANVLTELLGYFRNQADLAQTIVVRSGEAEFYHLLDNPADISGNYIPYGYIQSNVSAIGNMYKVMNPDEFIKATNYRKFPPIDLNVCFEYLDEMTGELNKLAVDIKKVEGEQLSQWYVSEKKEADIVVSCMKRDLSSVFVNSARIASLIKLGVMKLNKMECLPLIDMAFYYEQKPYSNSDF